MKRPREAFSPPVTTDQIDEMLRFLPLFEKPGRAYVGSAIPFPDYLPDVREFFQLAAQPWWTDTGYQPGEATRMLADDDVIRRATLDEVRTMLTYCVRGERFCDGHWESVLRSGRVVALLRRLQVLRAGMHRSGNAG